MVKPPLVDPDRRTSLGTAAAPPVGLPGPRRPLSRRRILETAVAMIDEHGLNHLTMRRLGSALGVEAMALYHYVHSREDLLDGIVERVTDDLLSDSDLQLAGDHWQDYLRRLAHGVRRSALAHPKVFPLIVTRPSAAPWVLPPLRSLRWMESFLDALHRCGFTDACAGATYRAFSSFLVGQLLLEVSVPGTVVDPDAPPGTDLGEYPRLTSLLSTVSQDHAAVEFELALRSLLERLERLERRADVD